MEGRRGLRAKVPFFLLSPEQNREGGRTAALSAGELGKGGGHGGLQKHEEVEGFRFPYYLGLGRSEAAAPRGPAGNGAVGRGGGHGKRENGEGGEGNLSPLSPRVEMQGGGGATVAGGGRLRRA